MLKNFDEDWNEISGNELGKATYTGLRPGKYNFIVYTANNDKVWGEIPYEINHYNYSSVLGYFLCYNHLYHIEHSYLYLHFKTISKTDAEKILKEKRYMNRNRK